MHAQDSVRNELYEIFGDSRRDATMEDLKAMSYLERVIKETMRLYPSVTGITRTLKEPLRLGTFYTIFNEIIKEFIHIHVF